MKSGAFKETTIMISNFAARSLATLALCLPLSLSWAQTPGTSGPANPKEVGKPGTSANSGTGRGGALNSSDAKAANAPADGASAVKTRMENAKQRRVVKRAASSASAP